MAGNKGGRSARPSIVTIAALLWVIHAATGMGQAPPAPTPTPTPPPPAEEGFVPLFNGTDLTGWVVHEGTELIAQEGALVSNPKAPGIIRTEKAYADFDLRLEYWIDAGDTHEANGGVFFRIGDRTPPGPGYEAQISLQDPKNPLGSIYNRVSQNLELVRSIAPEKQWNSLEIKAIGPRIQLWTNGEQLQDCVQHEFRKGFIGLQHHHNGCTVKYRNIRIKELSEKDAEPGWESLFNGTDLTGWTPQGAAQWKVDGGRIWGRGGPGHLYFAGREFENFELRAMVKVSEKGNSGLIFRSHWPEQNPADWPLGYECAIDNWDEDNTAGPKNVTGGIFGLAFAPLLTRDDTWISLRIHAAGNQIQTFVNGRKVTDFQNGTYTKGLIALQSIGAGASAYFRDIYVREIK